MNDSLIKWLEYYKCALGAQILKFQGAQLLRTLKIPLTGGKTKENRIETDDTEWVVSYSASSVLTRGFHFLSFTGLQVTFAIWSYFVI